MGQNRPNGVNLSFPDFDAVWRELRDRIGRGLTIKTLRQERPNWLEWTGEAIRVRTNKGVDTLGPDMVQPVWDSLREKGVITDQDVPGPARFRFSSTASLLSLLPCVDYTVYPKITLFRIDHEFTNTQIMQTFKVGLMGGIRYASPGTSDRPVLAVFITGAGNGKGEGHPYQDRWEDEATLLYTGEGLEGDQTLTKGNLVLQLNQELGFPLYGFQKLAPDRYRYLGRFRVLEVHEEQQPDRRGLPRRVFVFRMHRVDKPVAVDEGGEWPPDSWEDDETPPGDADQHKHKGRTPTTSGSRIVPRLDLAAIASDFAGALRESHVSFGRHHEALVRAFVAALACKPFVILTGLSGAGKTQIALRFGDWLGAERRQVVPVRPDWTGPEFLLGYPDALLPARDGRRAWHVPDVLAFLLKAAHDPDHPYLLVLDEMNLAHVERYFADILSGMESGEPCLPNLQQEKDGLWRPVPGGPEKLPFPRNVFLVGTVNVDETTYMFSPKVLDRASTFEFRVATDDLVPEGVKPTPCRSGDPALVAGFLAIARDDRWHLEHPAPFRDDFVQHLRALHALLAEGGFEFGHRVFYEALRFAALLVAAGEERMETALDRVVMQKMLPRLHGTRRRLEGTLAALGQYCFHLRWNPEARFDPENPPSGTPRLPLSFDKVRRMMRNLRANQFVSFAEA